MNTSSVFNSRRFYNLFRRDIMLNHKLYIFTLTGIAFALFLLFVFNMTNVYNLEYKESDYIKILTFSLIYIAAFIGSSFPELSDKKGTCNYLLLPSSIFEKYLVQFFIRFVIFIPLALLLFIAMADVARLTATQINLIHGKNIYIEKFNFSCLFPTQSDKKIEAIILFGLFSAGTFLFSARLFFKRFALVKTLILGTILFYLFYCFMVILSHIFYPETQGFNIKINEYEIVPQINSVELFISCFACLSWLFFLPMGYYKLKEKQE